MAIRVSSYSLRRFDALDLRNEFEHVLVLLLELLLLLEEGLPLQLERLPAFLKNLLLELTVVEGCF